MSFLHIFSQSVACLLIHLTVSFAEQKLLIFNEAHYFFHGSIFFMDHAFVLYLKSYHFSQAHLVFLLCYLIVVHFELLFVKRIGYVPGVFFACGCPVVLAPFVKKTTLLHCIAFALLSKISWLYLCGTILGHSILFHWSFIYSLTDATLSWLLYLYSKFCIWIVSVFKFCFSSILCWLFWICCLPI